MLLIIVPNLNNPEVEGMKATLHPFPDVVAMNQMTSILLASAQMVSEKLLCYLTYVILYKMVSLMRIKELCDIFVNYFNY